jgi:hypothetical protein
MDLQTPPFSLGYSQGSLMAGNRGLSAPFLPSSRGDVVFFSVSPLVFAGLLVYLQKFCDNERDE